MSVCRDSTLICRGGQGRGINARVKGLFQGVAFPRLSSDNRTGTPWTTFM